MQKKINEKFGGSWGIIHGVEGSSWEIYCCWEKWLVFSSNLRTVIVWKILEMESKEKEEGANLGLELSEGLKSLFNALKTEPKK